MAAAHDFHRLYAALGLDAGCGIDALRQRMRRRIARLHPDRRGGAAITDGPPLAELLALYAAARRFHRVHGRLPGSSVRVRSVGPRPVAAGASAPGHPRAVVPRDARARTLVLLGIIAALLAWLAARAPAPDAAGSLASDAADAGSPIDARIRASTSSARTPPATDPQWLALGQDTEAVLALQGAPLQRGDETWDYGPSWIRFSQGRVVDWSSSPMYPLRAETRTPPDEAEAGQHTPP